MVDLMRMYEQNGYAIDARELPDHLPLFSNTFQPAAG